MSRKFAILCLGLGVIGCGKKETATDTGNTDVADADTDADADSDSDADVDADTDSDTDTDTTPACNAMKDGTWLAGGAAFGMQMSAGLAFDVLACSFEFGKWDMAMDAPTGGTVAIDQVTLVGNAYWESCVGTLTGDNSVKGVCAQDGAQFELATK